MLELLRKHAWSGNLRELQRVPKLTLVRSTGPIFLPDFLSPTTRIDTATAPRYEIRFALSRRPSRVRLVCIPDSAADFRGRGVRRHREHHAHHRHRARPND